MKTLFLIPKKILRPFTILFFTIFTLVSAAQKPANFSGTWMIDHSKSAAEFKDYNVTCIIIQTAETFSVEQIFQMQDGQKTSMKPIVYNLNGQVSSKEEQGGTDNISAEWSKDMKTLNTKFVRTMGGSDFGSMTNYTLSDDGKVLTVKTSDLTGESPMIQVYNLQR